MLSFNDTQVIDTFPQLLGEGIIFVHFILCMWCFSGMYAVYPWRESDLLKMELQTVVSSHMGVGNKSSGRATSHLSHKVSSQAPRRNNLFKQTGDEVII